MAPYRDSRLIRLALFSFFALALGYGYFESRNIFSGPSIAIETGTITTREPLIHIVGTVERISELRLNGRQVPVTEAGNFDEPYALNEGSNHVILEARDSRGRLARKTVDIVYIPETRAGR